MDVGSAVVVLLFVYAIFSSLGGGGSAPGPSYSSKTETGEVVSAELLTNLGTLPPAGYDSSLDEGELKLRIRSFIRSYAPKCGDEDGVQIADSIIKYTSQFNVNPQVLTALIARESRFNRAAVSSAGAQGLGQLLPSTAKALNLDDPFDIDQNVRGTTRYVRYLLDKWNGQDGQVPLALASYIEGPNAIGRNGFYRPHTVGYVKDILGISKQI